VPLEKLGVYNNRAFPGTLSETGDSRSGCSFSAKAIMSKAILHINGHFKLDKQSALSQSALESQGNCVPRRSEKHGINAFVRAGMCASGGMK
jgi:hypothetical protein